MGDIIVLLVLLALVSLIIWKMVKDKKSGKKCTCGCSECALKEHCHSKKK